MSASRPIGLEQARSKLPELVSSASTGTTHIITRHGRPVAALVPLSAAGRAHRSAGRLPLRGSGRGRGLWGAEPARTIDMLRAEWD